MESGSGTERAEARIGTSSRFRPPWLATASSVGASVIVEWLGCVGGCVCSERGCGRVREAW